MDNDRLDVDCARLQKAGAELININLQTLLQPHNKTKRPKRF